MSERGILVDRLAEHRLAGLDQVGGPGRAGTLVVPGRYSDHAGMLGCHVGNEPGRLTAEPQGSGGDAGVSDPSETIDEEVLRLRSQGQPYARISRDLGLDRAADAQQAFRRALRRLSAGDAKRVRQEEESRLDRLAERVRADTSKDDTDQARQLKTIERMRTQIRDDS